MVGRSSLWSCLQVSLLVCVVVIQGQELGSSGRMFSVFDVLGILWVMQLELTLVFAHEMVA